MAWQEPRFIYPQPESDPVKSAMEGMIKGIKIYSAVKNMSVQNALQSDIKKAYDETIGPDAMPTAPAQPNQAAQGFQSPKSYTPEQLTAMQGAQSQQGQALNPLSEASQGFGTAPQVANSPAPVMNVAQADEAAQAKYQQEMTDYQNKVIEKRAEFSGKLIDLHRKHGFVKEAADLENNYIKQVHAVAELDPDMAAKVWNNGWAGKQYGNLKVSKAEKWEALPDGSGVYNKSNPNEIHKFPSSIEEFTAGGQTFVKDNKGGIHQVRLEKPAATKVTTLAKNVPGYVEVTPDGKHIYHKNPGYDSTATDADERALRKENESAVSQAYNDLEGRLKSVLSTKGAENSTEYQRAEKIYKNLPAFRKNSLDAARYGKADAELQRIMEYLNSPDDAPDQVASYLTKQYASNKNFKEADLRDSLSKVFSQDEIDRGFSLYNSGGAKKQPSTKPTTAAAHAEARAAIKSGANKEAVNKRLKEQGYPTI